MFKVIAIIVLVLGITNRFWKPKTETSVLHQSDLVTPSHIPSPVVSQTPTSESHAGTTSESLIYPNSNLTSSNTYTTSDLPDMVVNWYKAYIQRNSFNIKTVINKTTNGNTKAVIKATGSDQDLDIEITRKSKDSYTTIKIN